MYSQRAGVAGSPEIHLILTSSLSVKLNGYPSRLSQVSYTCYQKGATPHQWGAPRGSIREDAVNPGGTVKS